MKGRKLQSQFIWTECRNFWDYFQTVKIEFSGIGTFFEQFWMNFWDCVRTVWDEFSGLFSGSLRLSSGLVLIPGLMSSGFVVCFGIIVIR